ncbi:type VII secretion-associated serine protease mycosin, partial [Streptomyces sp. NPDC049577]
MRTHPTPRTTRRAATARRNTALRLALALAAAAALGTAAAPPHVPDRLSLAGSGQCTYPARPIKGTPWALQRV